MDDSPPTSDDQSDSDSSKDVLADSRLSKLTRFSVAQTACLNAYYHNGMIGTGKKYSSQIAKAAADTQLTCDQVKIRHFSRNVPLVVHPSPPPLPIVKSLLFSLALFLW